MATHTDTNKLVGYQPGNVPALGDDKRYLANELAKIQNAIASLVAVAKLFEARMNANGLT